MALQHLSVLSISVFLVTLADSMSIKNILRKDPNSFAGILAQIDPSLYHEQIVGLEATFELLRTEKKSFEDDKALADKANVTAHIELAAATDDLDKADERLDLAKKDAAEAEQIHIVVKNQARTTDIMAQAATDELEKHVPSLEHQMDVVAGIIDDLHGLMGTSRDCITFDHSPTDIGDLYDRAQLRTTFTVTTTIPQDKKGCLFEAGATGRGTWVGIVQRENDYYFRLQAGEGTFVGDESDTDTAVIMVPLSSELIPTDGLTHIVTWKINNPGLELHIDGVETSTSRANVGFSSSDTGEWCGHDPSGFGEGAMNVAVGGILDEWKGGVTSGLEICSAFPE